MIDKEYDYDNTLPLFFSLFNKNEADNKKRNDSMLRDSLWFIDNIDDLIPTE